MPGHQWHDEQPIDTSSGLSSSRARASACSPQGSHATGLSLCWSRYGEVSPASRLATELGSLDLSAGGFWQRFHEFDDTRVLVRRRLRLHVFLELSHELIASRVAIAQHHDGTDNPSAYLVGRADRGGLRNSFGAHERRLDLERADSVAGRDD